jgi:hypothetical protein
MRQALCLLRSQEGIGELISGGVPGDTKWFVTRRQAAGECTAWQATRSVVESCPEATVPRPPGAHQWTCERRYVEIHLVSSASRWCECMGCETSSEAAVDTADHQSQQGLGRRET